MLLDAVSVRRRHALPSGLLGDSHAVSMLLLIRLIHAVPAILVPVTAVASSTVRAVATGDGDRAMRMAALWQVAAPAVGCMGRWPRWWRPT